MEHNMYWQPLSKGSKNPPLNKQILLRTMGGAWGIGIAYKDRKKVRFNFESMQPVHAWYCSPKEDFAAWSNVNL
jgi:hypothetical protein